jgi:hypothetical protein
MEWGIILNGYQSQCGNDVTGFGGFTIILGQTHLLSTMKQI